MKDDRIVNATDTAARNVLGNLKNPFILVQTSTRSFAGVSVFRQRAGRNDEGGERRLLYLKRQGKVGAL